MPLSTTPSDSPSPERLVWCGLAVMPLFYGLVLIQAATRPGFNLITMPLSLLALGPAGWVQTLAFVVSGTLIVTCAIGAWRTGRAGVVAAVLLGVYGLGMCAAGVFPSDPIDGFPIGSHRAATMSWHAGLHGLSFAISHIAVIGACVVLALRFRKQRHAVMAIFSVVTALVTPLLIVAGFGNPNVMGLAFFATGLIAMSWLGAVAVTFGRLHSAAIHSR